MKKEFLVSLLLIISTSLFGSNYYVSNSGSDNNAGTSKAEAWETLSKVNASMASFNPGDSILFKRGDIFIGTLTITTSGNSTNSIVFGAFDSGPKPVIKASTQISSWVRNGNIWTADCPDCPENITNLFIDDKFQSLGRYPNDSYLTVTSGIGMNVVIDSKLNFPDDFWNNADIAIKTADWVIDVVSVTSQIGTRINLEENTSYGVREGYGYFFQNHINTLDIEGEWVYNRNQGTILVYSTEDISSKKVEIAFHDYCVYFQGQDYITIENLTLTHSRVASLYSEYSDHIIFNNNYISYSGGDGISLRECDYSSFEYNMILNTNNNGFHSIKSDYGKFTNNIVKKTALIPGRGYSGNAKYLGVLINVANDFLIEYNEVDSTGFNGIEFLTTNNAVVKNNFVNYSCLIKDDGGGIYTWGNKGTGNKIVGNIVLNSVGNREGTTHPMQPAQAIYIDGYNANITVENNTSAFCNIGVFVSHSTSIKVHNNVCYDNRRGLMLWASGDYTVDKCEIFSNSFFGLGKPDQWELYFEDAKGVNSFENNIICDPFDPQLVRNRVNKIFNDYTIEEWNNQGYVSDKPIPLTFAQSGLPDTTGFIIFDYNPTKNTITRSLQGTYRDLDNNLVTGSIEIGPYSSIILLKEFRSILGTETTPNGQIEFCQGIQNTTYSTDGTPLASTYSWELSPVSAGTVNSDDIKTISINWNPLYSGIASISYLASGPNNFNGLSPPLQVNILPKPHQPDIPSGPSSLFQNAPQSDYTTIEIEDATSYEWKMNPPEAGRLLPFGNTCGFEWNEPFFGTAYVSVRAENGCGLGLFSDSLKIQVQEAELAYGIINIFTPNGDGFNDYWSIPFIRDFPDATIKIFDRSNRLLIEYNGLDSSWNGTINGELVPMGSYLYVIDLKTGKPPIKGYVTVLR